MMNRSIPSVAVIIPTYNGWEYTRKCLASLRHISWPRLEIILINDGSTDETEQSVAAEFPEVQVLTGDGNLWWTGSINLGCQYALAHNIDYILALNNDVIVAPTAIAALVECAQQHPNAIIGSMIYDMQCPSKIWCAGGILRWPWPGEMMLGNGEEDIGQYDGVRPVAWTPGMGTLVARKILTELKLYDFHNMPQYLADTDFTLRANRAGYPVLVTSTSKLYNNVVNTGGISTKQKRITLPEFYSIFTSFRSPDYWRARLTFMWCHCPLYWLLLAILLRYSRLIVYGLKRMFA